MGTESKLKSIIIVIERIDSERDNQLRHFAVNLYKKFQGHSTVSHDHILITLSSHVKCFNLIFDLNLNFLFR